MRVTLLYILLHCYKCFFEENANLCFHYKDTDSSILMAETRRSRYISQREYLRLSLREYLTTMSFDYRDSKRGASFLKSPRGAIL